MKTPPPGTGHTTLRGTVAAVRAAALAWSEAILADPAADVDQHDPSGRTALMHAARAGDLDLLDRLLARSADSDRIDDWGWTPLTYAVGYNHLAIAVALLDHGADPNAGGIGCWEAMDLLPPGRASDFVELLIDRGADLAIIEGGLTIPEAFLANDRMYLVEMLDTVLARSARARARQRLLGRLTAAQRVAWLPKSCAAEAAARPAWKRP